MQIWVDADACPGIVKEILFRAAKRTQVTIVLVANQPMRIPSSPYIKFMQVKPGLDVADNHIVACMQSGDLVVTADIPLANDVVDKGGVALNPRGQLYTPANIKQCLSIRNFHQDLRGSGVATGGPAQLTKKEIQAFANCLDQFLAKR